MSDVEGEYPKPPRGRIESLLKHACLYAVFVHYTSIDSVQAGPSGFRALADVSG